MISKFWTSSKPLESVAIVELHVEMADFTRLTYGLDVYPEELCMEIIRFILEYVSEKTNVEFGLSQCVSDIIVNYQSHLTKDEYDYLEKAIDVIARKVVKTCVDMGLYDVDGILRYKFDKFIGYDIILRRMTDEEIEGMDG